jgi:hypothetical protein
MIFGRETICSEVEDDDDSLGSLVLVVVATVMTVSPGDKDTAPLVISTMHSISRINPRDMIALLLLLLLLGRRLAGPLELVIVVLANGKRRRRTEICYVLLLFCFWVAACGILSMLDPAIVYYIDLFYRVSSRMSSHCKTIAQCVAP